MFTWREMVYDGEYTCKQIGKINWRGSRMRQMQRKAAAGADSGKDQGIHRKQWDEDWDKLPNEFQLAEICGVGRSTIREAIKLLVFPEK